VRVLPPPPIKSITSTGISSTSRSGVCVLFAGSCVLLAASVVGVVSSRSTNETFAHGINTADQPKLDRRNRDLSIVQGGDLLVCGFSKYFLDTKSNRTHCMHGKSLLAEAGGVLQ